MGPTGFHALLHPANRRPLATEFVNRKGGRFGERAPTSIRPFAPSASASRGEGGVLVSHEARVWVSGEEAAVSVLREVLASHEAAVSATREA